MKNILSGLTLCALALIVGCTPAAHKQGYDWSAFNDAKPRSILILPVINNSVDVDAPLLALSTLPTPLGKKGYYVFPVNTVKTVLEQEGLHEGASIQQMGSPLLASMFGADSVLYVSINKWDAEYALINTTVTVSIDYLMHDKNGVEIWQEKVTTRYSPQRNNSGNPMADLIAAAIVAGMTRAAPDYMPLMHQANHLAFNNGPKALPAGPYAPVKTKAKAATSANEEAVKTAP